MNILRKSLVMQAFALVSISAMAEQFCYLTFETKDGTKASGQDLVKGGSWDSSRDACRSEYCDDARDGAGRYANVGFRVVRVDR